MSTFRRSCALAFSTALVAAAIVGGIALASPASAATTTPAPTPTQSVQTTAGNSRVAGFAIVVVIFVGIGFAARAACRRHVNRD